jgi:hypothetical protein
MIKPRSNKEGGLEFGTDAWARFERAIDVVAKSPPQHRAAKKPKKHDSEAPEGATIKEQKID